MAVSTIAGIDDTWKNLKENPVFKRTLMPRGLRFFLNNPIVRSLGLTLLALSAYEWTSNYFLAIPIWTSFVMALVFWFLVMAVQRYFCWLELTGLSRSGTLEDYLNSGLSRADVAMGVIMPAVISETVAVAGVMTWFLITTEDTVVRIVLILFIFLRIKSLFSPPFLYHPDTETYMRKRNPITLFFISFAVIVPLFIWFSIYFALLYLVIFLSGIFSIALTSQMVFLICIFGAFFLSTYPINLFNDWRLRRFLKRYGSFDQLFESYIEDI